MPPRSNGKSSPSAAAASIIPSAASSTGSVSGATSIAASPIIFTRRTGAVATSAAISPSRPRDAAEILGRQLLTERREADHVEKARRDLG